MRTMGKDVRLTRNFWLSEAMCKCNNCPGLPDDLALARELAGALQSLRDVLWNVQLAYECRIIATSWFRCPEHNRAVGGAAESIHLTGGAADVYVQRPDGKLVDARTVALMARAMGAFSGIIAYPEKRVAHLDRRMSLSKAAYFRNFGPFQAVGGVVAAWDLERLTG